MLIIHFLQDFFKLYYCNRIIVSDSFKIDGNVYHLDKNSKESEGFLGFFDWLRSDEETIVGIRLCFFEHQNYNDFLISLPYVKPTFDNKCIEVLFSGSDQNFDLSGDQDFTNNYVYKSEMGDYLFTFGLDHLTDKELNSLLKYVVTLADPSA